ncbi:thrombospondin-1-like [Saccostrea cucullata]|uniref:thrombospondin-1-like n=1 Tax=Saccostrea cuccullata TaxID=36930 RepID=UPI002ED5A998
MSVFSDATCFNNREIQFKGMQSSWKVDGGWTQFSYVWQSCTVTCGGGIQSGQERRTCTNPSPYGDGKPCEGSSYGQRASRSCNTHPCPVNGNWSEFGPYSEWGICSVTCGKGKEQRNKKRECDNPKPQNGGQNCTGTNIYTDERVCNLSPCPVNGGWSEFVPYGDWSQCSVSCSNGVQTRVLFRTCSEPAPLYGGKPCMGRSTRLENKQCRGQGCPVPGGWSIYGPYSEWTQCSSSCGNGIQERTRNRTCNNPVPQNGGKDCVGSSIEQEQRKCNIKFCSGCIML